MTRLQAEYERLHFAPADPGGRSAALLLQLLRPAGWEPAARVWQGVQGELDLPAPALAVDGRDAYQLWFGLAEPVAQQQAEEFLALLSGRWLADVPPERLRLHASVPAAAGMLLPPAQVAPDRWSAFLAPDLAPLFADERCLDLAPSPDAQAEVLSRVQPIGPVQWERALERLRTGRHVASTAQGAIAPAPAAAAAGPTQDPRAFLLQVMNDPGVAMQLRIEAAKALLPWSTEAQRR